MVRGKTKMRKSKKGKQGDKDAGVGPIYGVQLIDSLPLGSGSMRQALPDQEDLLSALDADTAWSGRLVAGYELLLHRYQKVVEALEATKGCLRYSLDPFYTNALGYKDE